MSTLMYKDKPVLELTDSADHKPDGVKEVLSKGLLPFQLFNPTNDNLREWIIRRSIPNNRDGIDDVREMYGNILSDRGKDRYASVSDSYWIRVQGYDTWKKVTFFAGRKWVPDTGDMFFAPWEIKDIKRITTASPTMSTDGRCRKDWICRDNIPALVKEGWSDGKTGDTPLGEVLTSVLCERLGINSVKSEFICYKGTLCSKADCFIKEGEELVTMDMIADRGTKMPDETMYDYLKRMMKELRIKDGGKHLDEQILVDNLTGNANRELRDIGFIRNIENGQMRPAPIFDSGSAYWQSHAVQDLKKQKYFSDVEADVVNRMKKQYDMAALTDKKELEELFKQLRRYPDISFKKLDGLKSAIQNRNRFLVEKEK